VRARSGALIKRAIELADKKEWAEAERLTRAAWELESAAGLKDAYEIQCNLGFITFNLKKWVSAAAHLSTCLRHISSERRASDPDLVRSSTAMLVKAKSEVAMFTIEVNVRGAKVDVNGTHVGTSPLPAEVFAPPGWVTVGITAPGYKPSSKMFDVRKGQVVSVNVDLAKTEVPGPSVVTSRESRGLSGKPSGPSRSSAADAKSASEPRSAVPLFASAALTITGAAVGAGLLIAAGTRDGQAEATASALQATGGDAPCSREGNKVSCDSLHLAAVDVRTLQIAGACAMVVAAGGGVWMTYELVKSGGLVAAPGAKRDARSAGPKPDSSKPGLAKPSGSVPAGAKPSGAVPAGGAKPNEVAPSGAKRKGARLGPPIDGAFIVVPGGGAAVVMGRF
jgi:hypothetical protein